MTIFRGQKCPQQQDGRDSTVSEIDDMTEWGHVKRELQQVARRYELGQKLAGLVAPKPTSGTTRQSGLNKQGYWFALSCELHEQGYWFALSCELHVTMII